MATQTVPASAESSRTAPWAQIGISEYLEDLTPKQRRAFQASFGQTADLKDVLNALQQEHGKAGAQKRAAFIHKMETLSKPLQQFSAAIDVAAQAQATFSFIWGPLKAVVLVIKSYVSVLEMITRVLEQITFATCSYRLLYLFDSISCPGIQDMHGQKRCAHPLFIQEFAETGQGIFLRSILQPLKVEMEDAIRGILERSQEVDVTALLADMKHSRNERALQAQTIAGKFPPIENYFNGISLGSILTRILDLSTELNFKKHKDLRLWLSPVDCRSEHSRRLSLRLPGTCQWLLDMPQFNQIPLTAEPSTFNLCLLSGKPGCGKSLLASALIEHLSESLSIPILFYFFNAVREAQNSFTSLLRSLLFQLLDLDSKVGPLLLPLYESSGDDHPLSPDILWAAFVRSLPLANKPMIIIDALDECEDRDVLIPRLLEIASNFPAVKMVLISRPLFDITSTLDRKCFHHQIEATDVKSDIEAYISHCVETSVKLQKTNLKKEIVASLSRGSDGMFLWARLLLDDLTTLPTVREIKKRLSALPSGLHMIYRQILFGLKSSLKPHQLELSRRVLTWVTATQRPLKLPELDIALAVNSGDTDLDDECRMIMPEADILQTCGPLIEIIGGSIVQVVHLSVKEFLTRPRANWDQEDELIKDLLVDPQDANIEITQTCIDYLSFIKFTPPFDKLTYTDGLLRYASTHWIQHFSVAGAKLCGQVERFTTSDHAIFWLESWMHEYHQLRGVSFDPDDVVLLEASLAKTLLSHSASALDPPEQDCGVIAVFERRRVFAINKFGAESDYAITSSADLARCYHRQGRQSAAEKIFTQILTAQEQRYGTESIQTLDTLSNLALLFHDQGRLEETERLNERVYEGRKATLGEDAAPTLDSMVNLAMAYLSRGRLADSERINIDVLGRWKSVVGEDNPGVMNILNNLALVYREMGKYERACNLFQEALEGRERLLGKEHPDSMASLSHLGNVLMAQGKLQDSRKALEESLSRRRRVLIKHHIDTLDGIHSVAQIYERLDLVAEAEDLLNEALPACRNTLPLQHPYTLNVLSTMSLVYIKQGRFAEAELLQKQSYQGRKEVQGEAHSATFSSEHNFGRIFLARGDFTQAEAHFKKAYDLRKANLGGEHPDTVESRIALLAMHNPGFSGSLP